LSLSADLAFALKHRCPACREGRLFEPYSVSVVKECGVCHAKLGQHDVGDGASVFLIFLLGVLIIPMAWGFECLVAPPLWVHVVLWGSVAVGLIALILPTIKALIILFDYRHRQK
jgi:uncharacterized protein (DUF983 family)